MGRPSSYEPSHDQMLIQHMSGGKSFESFAGLISKGRSTIFSWVEQFPAFKEAKEIGKAKAQLFWEGQMLDGLWQAEGEKKFNNTLWIFVMKNMFGWRDVVQHSVESNNKNTTSVDLVVLNEFQKEY